jgi:[acyl-carrier-protein] S-malonyltransferase
MGLPWQDHPAWATIAVLSEATGRDIAALLTGADAETLRATRNAQLAAFALSLVILEATRGAGLADTEAGATGGAVAGHSLGEYTALVAAGALNPMDGARLVAARGDAMQAAADAQPGTMAAVLGLDPDRVAEACAGVEGAWPANDNAPGQVVIAGTAAGVEAAGEVATELGAKRVMPLAVGGAFHSPLMAPAQTELDEALHATTFAPSDRDVVANVDASRHRDGWPRLLSDQLVSPVRWRESLLTLSQMGISHFLELGPGTELSGMVKRTVDGAARANIATPDDLAALEAFLKDAV